MDATAVPKYDPTLQFFRDLQRRGKSRAVARKEIEAFVRQADLVFREQQWSASDISKRHQEITQHINLVLGEVYNVDLNENHYVLHGFMMTVGGELYFRYEDDTDLNNHAWIVLMDGTYFDHLGALSDIGGHGKLITNLVEAIQLPAISDEDRHRYSQSLARLTEIYFQHVQITNAYVNKILTEKYGPFIPLSEDTVGRVYTISYHGQTKILRIFDFGEYTPRSAEEFLATNLELASAGIAPRILDRGIISPENGGQKIVYIVMDKIPLTLRQINDRQEQQAAIQQAIALGYRMNDLGYYKIDNHAGNFLYDPESRRVYAIDFADLVRVPTATNRFPGFIRDLQ
jgi:hypothetical protein